jgi:hypothetical protein
MAMRPYIQFARLLGHIRYAPTSIGIPKSAIANFPSGRFFPPWAAPGLPRFEGRQDRTVTVLDFVVVLNA